MRLSSGAGIECCYEASSMVRVPHAAVPATPQERIDGAAVPQLAASGGGSAAVRAHGFVGQFGLVTLPHEHPPGAIALAGPRGRHRDALRQEPDGGVELLFPCLGRQRGLGQLGRHASAAQIARDTLRAPALEGALVLGKALGKAGVVKVARRLQLADRVLDRLRLDALALQAAAQFGDGPVPGGDGPVGELYGPLVL